MLLNLFNCPPGQGEDEVMQLIGPLFAAADLAAVRTFISTPKLDRTDEQVGQYGVIQDQMFGTVHVQATIGAGSRTPTRSLLINTIKIPSTAQLVGDVVPGDPCNMPTH